MYFIFIFLTFYKKKFYIWNFKWNRKVQELIWVTYYKLSLTHYLNTMHYINIHYKHR